MSRDAKTPLAVEQRRRLFWLTITFIMVAVILIVRLFYLQVIKGDYYAARAISTYLRSYEVKARRGNIYDRNGNILAGNRAAYDLFVVPRECEGKEEKVCALLEKLLQIDGDALLVKIRRYARRQPYKQILVKRDVSREQFVAFSEFSYALPGVFSIVRPVRQYPYHEVAGQIMGYLSEVTKEEIKKQPGRYSMGDLIGRRGLEKVYEDTLKGHDGKLVVQVYNEGVLSLPKVSFGQENAGTEFTPGTLLLDQLGREAPIQYGYTPRPGSDVTVTLDAALQQKAEELLRTAPVPGLDRQAEGAIVVMNAETGAVLAMASAPGYDPNVFLQPRTPLTRAYINNVLYNRDGLKRGRHRAYEERYFPGSVFKIVVAAAALEEGIIDKNFTVTCNGKFTRLGPTWYCWRHWGHGRVNVVDALAYSCDVFFYEVGLMLGPERIKEWATKLGMGLRTGIDLPGEDTGLVPWPEWKFNAPGYAHLSRWDRKWQKGDTVNLSIGQGDCKITPLQLAVTGAAIINGGRIVRPFLNRERPISISEPVLSPHTLAIIQEGMRACVERRKARPRATPDDRHPSFTGTGRIVHIDGLDIIGKTGSAQVVPRSFTEGQKDEEIKYEWRDNAWFVAGVLNRSPRLVVSVCVPHGLHGATGAGPLAREIIRFYYEHCAQKDDQEKKPSAKMAGKEGTLP